MINRLKSSKDPAKEEKIANYETKRSEEMEQVLREFNTQKIEGSKEIKDKYNSQSTDIKIETEEFITNFKDFIKILASREHNGSPINLRLQSKGS